MTQKTAMVQNTGSSLRKRILWASFVITSQKTRKFFTDISLGRISKLVLTFFWVLKLLLVRTASCSLANFSTPAVLITMIIPWKKEPPSVYFTPAPHFLFSRVFPTLRSICDLGFSSLAVRVNHLLFCFVSPLWKLFLEVPWNIPFWWWFLRWHYCSFR